MNHLIGVFHYRNNEACCIIQKQEDAFVYKEQSEESWGCCRLFCLSFMINGMLNPYILASTANICIDIHPYGYILFRDVN